MMDLIAYIPSVHNPFFQNLVTSDSVEYVGPLEDVDRQQDE